MAVSFILWKKPEHPKKTTDLTQDTDKVYHIMSYRIDTDKVYHIMSYRINLVMGGIRTVFTVDIIRIHIHGILLFGNILV